MKRSTKYRGVYIIEGKLNTSYLIDYTHPGTGARIRKVVPANSEKQAADLRAIELTDARRGAVNKAYGIKGQCSPLLFTDALDKYLEYSRENKKSWQLDEYKAGILKKYFIGFTMGDITIYLVEQYKSFRAKQVQKKTVNHELILGRQTYKKVTDWGLYDGENPFAQVPNFKTSKAQKPGYLTADEASAIISHIIRPVQRDMAQFAFYEGWRISEIRALKRKDVDLERKVAIIRDPKNGQPAQMLLRDETCKIIQRQIKHGEYVFHKGNGEPFRTCLNGCLRNAAQRAGIPLPPGKLWHLFRHTWATMMLRAGADIPTLQAMGNWKDPTMPLHYAQSMREVERRALIGTLPTLDVKTASIDGDPDSN